jgi:hypothetical protein
VQNLPGAVRVYHKSEQLAWDNVQQHKVFVTGEAQECDILMRFILSNADNLGQMVVFVRTQGVAHSVAEVCSYLLCSRRRPLDTCP